MCRGVCHRPPPQESGSRLPFLYHRALAECFPCLYPPLRGTQLLPTTRIKFLVAHGMLTPQLSATALWRPGGSTAIRIPASSSQPLCCLRVLACPPSCPLCTTTSHRYSCSFSEASVKMVKVRESEKCFQEGDSSKKRRHALIERSLCWKG